MKEVQYLIIILLKLWLNSVICICSNLEASLGYCLKTMKLVFAAYPLRVQALSNGEYTPTVDS